MPETLQPTPFWYLRHGETDWNLQGLSQGAVEVPLNETGRAQASAAAGALEGRGIARIVASSVGRAQETATIVAGRLGLPFATDRALREASFGDQEGLPIGEWYDRWVAGAYTPAGAEDFAAVRARAVGGVNRALEGDGLLLIVAHGALFRALRAAMGHSATVRTANGVAIFCEPATPRWTLTELVS